MTTNVTTNQFPLSIQPTTLPKGTVVSAIWIILLLVINAPLFSGVVAENHIFFPEDVRNGEWWRLFTHPFVHLSWYHLLLDGVASILLLNSLEEKSYSLRIFYSAMAAMGAVSFGILLDNNISTQGLCGLSGAAHGLMGISAIEMICSKQLRNMGWLCLLMVSVKCIYELMTGQVLFEFLQLGLTGQPLAASHAGGLVGGLTGVAVVLIMKRWSFKFKR